MGIAHSFFNVSVRNYSYEAGVRQLERTIGAICRAVAVKIAEKSPSTHDSAPSDGGSKNVISEDLSCVPIHPSSPIPPESTIAQTEIKDTSLEVLALPPELPIVIDELALEDILGVSAESYALSYSVLCFIILLHPYYKVYA